jgi:GNAT superfamily N-acetyltransferase
MMSDCEYNITTIMEKMEYIDLVVGCVWKQWSREYVEHTDITSAELLKESIYNMCKHGGDIPMIYVIYNRENDSLIGFCFIENEDCGVKPWLSPWLSNLYIMEEYRNKGYSKKLFEYILPMYKTLHLWCTTLELSSYYNKYGFAVIDVIYNYEYNKTIYVMRRE